ncbi:MAG TPA: NAD-dependent epimerase/dehydratase family protein [Oryzihumus sp.]|nr:NAD-dependent epimerase/dehydratase family protein [Oryzihumus sp.]
MKTALVLGGTGSLSSTVERLVRDGWRVTVTARSPRAVPSSWAGLGVRFHVVDRSESETMGELVGDGFDLLVDGQCYTPEQAEHLAQWSHRCASTVMLSARAVYIDSRGRHLNSEEPPQWDGPTPESQPTMPFRGEPHASREGYGSNKAEAERVLMARGARASMLRPSKIHGPGVRQVREWPIVQRVLDGRSWLPVRDGDRVESTTSTAVLADAVLACASNPATRLLNVADADAQPARQLAALVARAAGAELQQVDVDATCSPPIGVLPWNQDNLLDISALTQLGVTPTTFADTIQQEVAWVAGIASRGQDGGWQLPEWLHIATPDYAAEERCRPAPGATTAKSH